MSRLPDPSVDAGAPKTFVASSSPSDGSVKAIPASAGGGAGASAAGRARAYGLLAVACYLPMLLTKPGIVSDDTKTYLYLDPGRLLRQAASMWNPAVALGTVTHQNIGYLVPMGPFFWALSALHVPVWVSQRLWLGSLLFGAAAGVAYLSRLVGIGGLGTVVAGVAYGFSPYVLQYAGRISVILLPFSGLPWMIAFMVLALRRGGWRYPALFAVVLALVSGINASSVVYVIAAPLLWLPYAVFALREVPGRRALLVLLKVGVLSLLCSLWWIAGLSVEGLYGVDILKYTESVEAASSAAASSEVVRGLGYWYFYNSDRLGPWTQASVELTTRTVLLAVSYAVPIGAFVSAAVVRWRQRGYFVLLILAGLVLSVGPHPFGRPTPVGALDKAFMTKTTVGLALRSSDRATPLVVLGLAMLLGAGVTAAVERFGQRGLAVGWLAVAVALGADAPLVAGDGVIAQFSQPARPPAYVSAAARYLDSTGGTSRVYALPGNDFAAYRYGDTVDPIWPALIDRPFATREQLIQGSMPTANLLYALDGPLQQQTTDWRALAPIARLMSAGDVLVEYDEQYERYDTPRPALLHEELASTPPGLGAPVGFGTQRRNVSKLPMLDETYFDLPSGVGKTRPVVVYPVADPRPIARADSLADPLVVAGDNVGVVDAAGLGLLDSDPTVLFAGTLDTHRLLASEVLRHPAQLVVTDTNRKQAFEWNTVSENTGYTETAREKATSFVADDPGFDMFPGAPPSSMTTSLLPGVAEVTASSYGTADTLRPEFRPANALDGNPATAWETEGTGDSALVGQWWQVTARQPLSADHVTLVQPQLERNATWLTNQWITRATLTFDGRRPVTVRLGAPSRHPGGQVVGFSRRRFRTLRIRIDETNLTHRHPQPVGSSLVGLAEVDVGTLHTAQVVVMPTDLLDRAGHASLADRLTLIMTRERVAPVPPRSDPEVAIDRQFRLPTARSFSLVGTARISSLVPDDVVDALVGRTNALVTSATSSSRMPGNLSATASSTLDGDPNTVWMPGLGRGAVDRSWLSYRFAHRVSLDRLSLLVASDGEHSRPRQLLISAGGVTRAVALPPIPVTPTAGSLTRVPVTFAPVSGDSLRITFSRIAVRKTLSYETSLETALPIGIATVSIPGAPLERSPARIPSRCRDDLLRLDGRPVPITVSGATATALAGGPLNVALCGRRAGVRLGAGTHLLEAADGSVTGLDLDQLAFDSAPGGGVVAEPGGGSLAPSATRPVPATAARVAVLSEGATSIRLRVSHAARPFLLVLGESIDKGWHAEVVGGKDLGPPLLVDGFANGWLVSAGLLGRSARAGAFDVTVDFAPQGAVDVALVVSAVSLLACLGVIAASMLSARTRRRRRRPSEQPPPGEDAPGHPGAGAAPGTAGSPAVGPAESPPAAVGQPGSPVFSPPLCPAPSMAWLPRACAIAVGGLLGLAIGGPVAGVGAAVVMAAADLVSRRRIAPAVAAAAVMAAAAVVVVLQEHLNRYPAGGGWASHFDVASDLVWAAVAVLSVDAILEVVAGRRKARRRRDKSDSSTPVPEDLAPHG